MRKILLLLPVILFILPIGKTTAQDKDFYSQLASISSQIEMLSGSFTQTKEVISLDVKIVSTGTFRYEKNKEIRFDYETPRVMSIVVKEKEVEIITEEKTTVYAFKGQKNAMAEMAQIMNICMKGFLKELGTNYELNYKLNEKGHCVTIKNAKKESENSFVSIDLCFDSSKYALKEVVVHERSGYVTTYVFSNVNIEGLL
ncbi:MAG: outer membrane lipoprotein carrier protein LolA [Bacteroidales bacterium]|jgi:outer membrane lipoprotein-sorting protein|nr:outer membrane lipoprotein carrier protein LolA [Bacteroidales bacterium]MDD3104959.1 outer membrane lipoprotein carrier protein LolA [Bacteroidales bacterium]MDD3549591.1 outer membrane lipoprotein carrier protein LolA [Bacteroidales bacterium]MDD4064749.1 outer membrane lipoprotein carrier protein LolA [Bacteroidales bacterium]MDD4499782.1 outer membrane lipoprotein carrier protein LolA [Bacteroidales bacterium]